MMFRLVIPIQFKKVESIEENLVVIATGMQAVEIRLAIRSSPNPFPVSRI
jgi:hypothetical protein